MEQITKYKRYTEKLEDIDSKKGIVVLYANAFNNIDSDGDVSLPGSFKRTIANNFKRMKHLYNHDRGLLIGLPIEMAENEKGLRVVSQLNMNSTFAKDKFAEYEFYTQMERSPEHSIGAIITDVVKNKQGVPELTDQGGFKVTEWKLLEYSTVPFGANEETPMETLKALNIRQEFESHKNAPYKSISIEEHEMFFIGMLEKMLSFPYSDQRKREIEKLLSKYQTQGSPDGSQNAPVPPAETKQETIDLSIIKSLIQF